MLIKDQNLTSEKNSSLPLAEPPLTDQFLHEIKTHGSPMFAFETYQNTIRSDKVFITSHWHHEIEILCIQRGVADVHIDGESIAVHAGDVVFINSGELHQITSQNSDILYHACLFPLEFLYFARPDYTQSHYLIPLSEKELLLPHFLPHGDSFADAIYLELMDIIATFDNKEAAYQLRIKACLIKILSLVFAQGTFIRTCDADSSIRQKNQQQLKEILHYIESHYADKILLVDIADHIHMSAKYFSQYFKKNFNMGFVDYLNHYRIEKACELIITTNMHMMEISFATGFDNFSYFIRTFKNITGQTPAAYRRTVQTV
ncbi:MAG: helix-turn-helix domain-containing protein [Lachnospiraceae bacterium]